VRLPWSSCQTFRVQPPRNPISRRYLLLVAALSGLVLGVGAVLSTIWYKPAPTQLHLKGTSAETGTAYGVLRMECEKKRKSSPWFNR
jgi:hypothetical protein